LYIAGCSFAKETRRNPIDLSLPQAKTVLGLLLDDEEFRSIFTGIIQRMSSRSDGRLRLRDLGSNSFDESCVCETLQQIGALVYEDRCLVVVSEFESLLSSELLANAVLSEEQLWGRLEGQRKRGRLAEEIVLKEERKRLSEGGRPGLAELAVRVSEMDISAGFDIQSFNFDGTPRYIEVKSSTGGRIRFEWSSKERKKAEEFNDNYWIYFLPLSHTLPMLSAPILQIRNPLRHIQLRRLIETSSSFFVKDPSRFRYLKRPRLTLKSPFVAWPFG
jgi:hypothetical protein